MLGIVAFLSSLFIHLRVKKKQANIVSVTSDKGLTRYFNELEENEKKREKQFTKTLEITGWFCCLYYYFDDLYTRFYVSFIVCFYIAGMLSSKVQDIVDEQVRRERKAARKSAEYVERIRSEHEQAIAGPFIYMITTMSMSYITNTEIIL